VVENAMEKSISSDISKKMLKDVIESHDDFVLHKQINGKQVKTMVYISNEYDTEMEIAESIADMNNTNICINEDGLDLDCVIKSYETYVSQREYEPKPNFKLNQEQKNAVKSTLQNALTLMTGPPGSGKSDVVNCICYIVTEFFKYSLDDVLLCAPTGKAASKLRYVKESIPYEDDENNNIIKGVTIHSAIWKMKKSNYSQSDNDSVDRDINDMYEQEFDCFKKKIVIVDEISMMDTQLWNLLLKCISKQETVVLFIGDHYQLPSINRGDVLRCLVSSKIITNHIELIKVYRYGNEMTDLANAIKTGVPFKIKNSHNIKWYKSDDVDTIYEKVFDIYSKSSSIQVIIPTKKNEIGCNKFNQYLHDKLKPLHASGKFFRGEKVMCTKNNREEEVSNGNSSYSISHNGLEYHYKFNFNNKEFTGKDFSFDRFRNTHTVNDIPFRKEVEFIVQDPKINRIKEFAFIKTKFDFFKKYFMYKTIVLLLVILMAIVYYKDEQHRMKKR
jgi:exodeoxyribonuclease V alpha subunit